MSSGIGILAILPIAIAMAAVMRAVAINYLGQSTTIGGAYASIRQHWYRYILIMMAMYTYAIVPAVMVMGVTFAIVAAVPVSFGRNLLVGMMVVLVLAAFATAFWWLLRWLLAVPASLMEGLTVHRSLKRSALLTLGARGCIFVMLLLLLLVVAVMMVIQYAIQIPMFILLWKQRRAYLDHADRGILRYILQRVVCAADLFHRAHSAGAMPRVGSLHGWWSDEAAGIARGQICRIRATGACCWSLRCSCCAPRCSWC